MRPLSCRSRSYKPLRYCARWRTSAPHAGSDQEAQLLHVGGELLSKFVGRVFTASHIVENVSESHCRVDTRAECMNGRLGPACQLEPTLAPKLPSPCDGSALVVEIYAERNHSGTHSIVESLNHVVADGRFDSERQRYWLILITLLSNQLWETVQPLHRCYNKSSHRFDSLGPELCCGCLCPLELVGQCCATNSRCLIQEGFVRVNKTFSEVDYSLGITGFSWRSESARLRIGSEDQIESLYQCQRLRRHRAQKVECVSAE